jgi:hypothetical protein
MTVRTVPDGFCFDPSENKPQVYLISVFFSLKWQLKGDLAMKAVLNRIYSQFEHEHCSVDFIDSDFCYDCCRRKL